MNATVALRVPDGSVTEMPLGAVTAGLVLSAVPWRTIRSRRGQRHFPGLYWSSTTGGHVVYESRLELARLLLADADREIVGIAAQPFLVCDDQRRHVPDFFFVRADGSALVVNVKPADRLEDPRVAGALAWADAIFAARGWQHEIWSATDPHVLSNVRFLAGYRRAGIWTPPPSRPLGDITSHWPQKHAVNLPRLGRIITADKHGTAILAAFCALAETLDRDDTPIDYDRRRAIANDVELLAADAWTSICGVGGTLRGAEFKLTAARLWLWETITGGLAEQAPVAVRRRSPKMMFARYHQFALRLPRQTAQALLGHARELLDVHGCRDEPITWSPPAAGIALDELPGPDPDTPGAQAAHALLARNIAPEAVAEQLGITLEHLRYFIRRHPRDSPFGAAGVIPSRLRLAASVTADELRRLVDNGDTLTAIAARYNVQRSTVRAKLIAHEIPIPANHRPRHEIDRAWLHEQYVARQRTMPEIAAETGASTATIARLIQKYAIPTRGRGAPSHHQSLTAGDGYPEPLASAVRRPGGTERVQHFQVYARTRSLNAAAKRLGAHSATLTTQLAALEAACGDALLERLTRDQRAQQLTTLGCTLLDQADEHLGPHPDAPPALPEPLASVLAAHWGDRILATFTAVTAFPTLNDAGHALNVHRSSLLRTIRNVETAVGEPVLTDHRRSAPLRLTSTGRTLLGQALEHGAPQAAARERRTPEPAALGG